VDWLKLIGAIGSTIGAVGIIVHYFLKYIKEESVRRSEESRAVRDNCKDCREDHGRLVTNHIAHSTEAMNRVAGAVELMTAKLEK